MDHRNSNGLISGDWLVVSNRIVESTRHQRGRDHADCTRSAQASTSHLRLAESQNACVSKGGVTAHLTNEGEEHMNTFLEPPPSIDDPTALPMRLVRLDH